MAKKKPRKPNKVYELRAAPTAPKGAVRILALDPGSRNFGISVVEVQDNKPRVLASAVLMNPVYNLVTFGSQRDLYMSEIQHWMEVFSPQGIIAERFQTRGSAMGPLIECVSAMIGLLAGKYNLPMKLTTASTWKNAFNRRFQVDLKEIYPEVATTPHQLDSVLIGCYGLEVGLRRQLSYNPASIIKQVEATSLMPLRRIK